MTPFPFPCLLYPTATHPSISLSAPSPSTQRFFLHSCSLLFLTPLTSMLSPVSVPRPLLSAQCFHPLPLLLSPALFPSPPLSFTLTQCPLPLLMQGTNVYDGAGAGAMQAEGLLHRDRAEGSSGSQQAGGGRSKRPDSARRASKTGTR